MSGDRGIEDPNKRRWLGRFLKLGLGAGAAAASRALPAMAQEPIRQQGANPESEKQLPLLDKVDGKVLRTYDRPYNAGLAYDYRDQNKDEYDGTVVTVLETPKGPVVEVKVNMKRLTSGMVDLTQGLKVEFDNSGLAETRGKGSEIRGGKTLSAEEITRIVNNDPKNQGQDPFLYLYMTQNAIDGNYANVIKMPKVGISDREVKPEDAYDYGKKVREEVTLVAYKDTKRIVSAESGKGQFEVIKDNSLPFFVYFNGADFGKGIGGRGEPEPIRPVIPPQK